MNPKILMVDIETAPNIGYIWRLWQEVCSMDMIAEDWYILCWCAKWVGDDHMYSSALPDHNLYLKDPKNDIEVMKDLYTLLDQADIVCGHNAAKFDIKKINTRFLVHNIAEEIKKYTKNFKINIVKEPDIVFINKNAVISLYEGS